MRGKGFTLIELMVVVLIVAILAAVAIPIIRGRIDAAKWSEGKAMIGSIGTGIRAYHAEKGVLGAPPTTLGIAATGLGFNVTAGDLDGTYFKESLAPGTFSFTIDSWNPTLAYTVTGVASAASGISSPSQVTFDSDALTPAAAWIETP